MSILLLLHWSRLLFKFSMLHRNFRQIHRLTLGRSGTGIVNQQKLEELVAFHHLLLLRRRRLSANLLNNQARTLMEALAAVLDVSKVSCTSRLSSGSIPD